jgi:GNAT superfamily N-acetyltransferase
MNLPSSNSHPMKTEKPDLHVRKAVRGDAPTILNLVRGLAEYEKLPPPDHEACERLVDDMFSQQPRISALLVEVDGLPAGYAFFFQTYSSFLALPTLYLEDLFVLPEFRKRRAGMALFRALVQEAVALNCGRMEWTVLDWNQLAIDFYKKIGAKQMKEWQLFRLTRPEMLPLVPQTGESR